MLNWWHDLNVGTYTYIVQFSGDAIHEAVNITGGVTVLPEILRISMTIDTETFNMTLKFEEDEGVPFARKMVNIEIRPDFYITNFMPEEAKFRKLYESFVKISQIRAYLNAIGEVNLLERIDNGELTLSEIEQEVAALPVPEASSILENITRFARAMATPTDKAQILRVQEHFKIRLNQTKVVLTDPQKRRQLEQFLTTSDDTAELPPELLEFLSTGTQQQVMQLVTLLTNNASETITPLIQEPIETPGGGDGESGTGPSDGGSNGDGQLSFGTRFCLFRGTCIDDRDFDDIFELPRRDPIRDIELPIERIIEIGQDFPHVQVDDPVQRTKTVIRNRFLFTNEHGEVTINIRDLTVLGIIDAFSPEEQEIARKYAEWFYANLTSVENIPMPTNPLFKTYQNLIGWNGSSSLFKLFVTIADNNFQTRVEPLNRTAYLQQVRGLQQLALNDPSKITFGSIIDSSVLLRYVAPEKGGLNPTSNFTFIEWPKTAFQSFTLTFEGTSPLPSNDDEITLSLGQSNNDLHLKVTLHAITSGATPPDPTLVSNQEIRLYQLPPTGTPSLDAYQLLATSVTASNGTAAFGTFRVPEDLAPGTYRFRAAYLFTSFDNVSGTEVTLTIYSDILTVRVTSTVSLEVRDAMGDDGTIRIVVTATDALNRPIPNLHLVLAIQGSTQLYTVRTSLMGTASVSWTPPTTGEFAVTVEWVGNAVYLANRTTVNLTKSIDSLLSRLNETQKLQLLERSTGISIEDDLKDNITALYEVQEGKSTQPQQDLVRGLETIFKVIGRPNLLILPNLPGIDLSNPSLNDIIRLLNVNFADFSNYLSFTAWELNFRIKRLSWVPNIPILDPRGDGLMEDIIIQSPLEYLGISRDGKITVNILGYEFTVDDPIHQLLTSLSPDGKLRLADLLVSPFVPQGLRSLIEREELVVNVAGINRLRSPLHVLGTKIAAGLATFDSLIPVATQLFEDTLTLQLISPIDLLDGTHDGRFKYQVVITLPDVSPGCVLFGDCHPTTVRQTVFDVPDPLTGGKLYLSLSFPNPLHALVPVIGSFVEIDVAASGFTGNGTTFSLADFLWAGNFNYGTVSATNFTFPVLRPTLTPRFDVRFADQDILITDRVTGETFRLLEFVFHALGMAIDATLNFLQERMVEVARDLLKQVLIPLLESIIDGVDASPIFALVDQYYSPDNALQFLDVLNRTLMTDGAPLPTGQSPKDDSESFFETMMPLLSNAGDLASYLQALDIFNYLPPEFAILADLAEFLSPIGVIDLLQSVAEELVAEFLQAVILDPILGSLTDDILATVETFISTQLLGNDGSGGLVESLRQEFPLEGLIGSENPATTSPSPSPTTPPPSSSTNTTPPPSSSTNPLNLPDLGKLLEETSEYLEGIINSLGKLWTTIWGFIATFLRWLADFIESRLPVPLKDWFLTAFKLASFPANLMLTILQGLPGFSDNVFLHLGVVLLGDAMSALLKSYGDDVGGDRSAATSRRKISKFLGEVMLDYLAVSSSSMTILAYNGLARLFKEVGRSELVLKLAYLNSSALVLGFNVIGEIAEDVAKHFLTTSDVDDTSWINVAGNLLEALTEIGRVQFNAVIFSRNFADLIQNVPGYELFAAEDVFLQLGMSTYLGQVLQAGIGNVLGLVDNLLHLSTKKYSGNDLFFNETTPIGKKFKMWWKRMDLGLLVAKPLLTLLGYFL